MEKSTIAPLGKNLSGVHAHIAYTHLIHWTLRQLLFRGNFYLCVP